MTHSENLIRQLLTQICDGEIDADSAARRILGIEHPPTGLAPPPPITARRSFASSDSPTFPATSGSPPTIASLIRAYGLPPPEIERDWQSQIAAFESEWLRLHGSPLPPIDCEDWFVDPSNRLSPRQAWEPLQTRPLEPPPAASLEPESEARHELDSNAPARPATLSAPTSARRAEVAKRQRTGRPTKLAMSLAAGLVLALCFGGWYGLSKQAPPDRNATTSTHAKGLSGPNTQAPPARAPSVAARRSPIPANSDPIDELTPQLLINPAAAVELPSEGLVGAAASPDLSRPAAFSASEIGLALINPSPEPSSAAEPMPDDADDPTVDSDWPADQQREARSANPEIAVTLPPPPAIGRDAEPFTLILWSPQQVTWEYPVATPIQLLASDDRSWRLVDQTNQVDLATLSSTDDGLLFTWAETAAGNPRAAQVAAGRFRLTRADGRLDDLLLRPLLRSDPLRFDFTQADSRVSWQLHGPPIFDSPICAIEVESPDSVVTEWIQQPDPEQVRRGFSILQWALSDSELPAIRCRLESRVGTRWSLRFRYAVRIDERSSWQAFSDRSLNTSLEQVTATLNLALTEQSHVSRQYSAASVSVRRQLKPSKDLLDQRVSLLQETMQQIRKLQTLAAGVAESRLNLSLSTAWPDFRQTLFETPVQP
ncbi:MAG: hypothetical protein EA381_21055 [Planctomycetaceae bacterium]|nr:MAG: hypothetical protein EA381_21055 [Planctomycetaceae bacterium]